MLPRKEGLTARHELDTLPLRHFSASLGVARYLLLAMPCWATMPASGRVADGHSGEVTGRDFLAFPATSASLAAPSRAWPLRAAWPPDLSSLRRRGRSVKHWGLNPLQDAL